MGELKQLIELFAKEWDVIQQAWITFLLSIVLIGGLIAIVFRMAYRLRIANLESGKMLLQEQISDLKGRIETRDEAIKTLQKPVIASANIGPLEVDRLPSAEAEQIETAVETTLRDFVIGKRWLFYYNVQTNGSKNLTFLSDGTIGEGQNKNEFRWKIEGDRLVIIRENGDVQNVFRRDPSGRLVFVEDVRAKGYKNQYIELL